MGRMFKKLTDLLGKSTDDPMLDEIKYSLDEEPVFMAIGRSAEFDFPKSGFSFHVESGMFETISFFIQTASTSTKNSQPYSGDLIGNVLTSDSRSDVERKLARKPLCSSTEIGSHGRQSVIDEYSLAPFDVSFSFDSADNSMRFVAVRLRERSLT